MESIMSINTRAQVVIREASRRQIGRRAPLFRRRPKTETSYWLDMSRCEV